MTPLSANRKITLNFTDFLDILLTYKGVVPVKEELGQLIAAIDNTEELTHVEFPSKENNLDVTHVYRIREWRDDLLRWEQTKKRDEAQRKIWNLRRENIERLSKAIVKMTSLDEDMAINLASRIVDKNNQSAANKFEIVLDV